LAYKNLKNGIFILTVSYCVTGMAETLLRSQVDGTLVSEAGESIAVSANAPVPLEPATAYSFESTGNVPVYIVPQSPKTSEIKISPVPVKNWPSLATQEKIDTSLNELMESILEIQELLKSGNRELASNKLDSLIKIYPSVSYLGFLRASILVLSGRNGEAVKELEASIAKHPQNKRAVDLLRKIKSR